MHMKCHGHMETAIGPYLHIGHCHHRPFKKHTIDTSPKVLDVAGMAWQVLLGGKYRSFRAPS